MISSIYHCICFLLFLTLFTVRRTLRRGIMIRNIYTYLIYSTYTYSVYYIIYYGTIVFNTELSLRPIHWRNYRNGRECGSLESSTLLARTLFLLLKSDYYKHVPTHSDPPIVLVLINPITKLY